MYQVPTSTVWPSVSSMMCGSWSPPVECARVRVKSLGRSRRLIPSRYLPGERPGGSNRPSGSDFVRLRVEAIVRVSGRRDPHDRRVEDRVGTPEWLARRTANHARTRFRDARAPEEECKSECNQRYRFPHLITFARQAWAPPAALPRSGRSAASCSLATPDGCNVLLGGVSPFQGPPGEIHEWPQGDAHNSTSSAGSLDEPGQSW